jgi:hypothetical protein
MEDGMIRIQRGKSKDAAKKLAALEKDTTSTPLEVHLCNYV